MVGDQNKNCFLIPEGGMQNGPQKDAKFYHN